MKMRSRRQALPKRLSPKHHNPGGLACGKFSTTKNISSHVSTSKISNQQSLGDCCRCHLSSFFAFLDGMKNWYFRPFIGLIISYLTIVGIGFAVIVYEREQNLLLIPHIFQLPNKAQVRRSVAWGTHRW